MLADSDFRQRGAAIAASPEWQHKLTARKPYPEYGPKAYIQVEAGLHYLKGNSLPYFSVTGEIWERPNARDCVACGCLHDEVLKFWPELKPVIDLHLSDSNGQPMSAEANGWYNLAGYYGGAEERYHRGNSASNYPLAELDPTKPWQTTEYRLPTEDECLQQFSDYVRIPRVLAKELAELWRCEGDWTATRRWFGEWLETEKGRFQAEADDACKLLDELIAKGKE